jgi:ABC-type multidrug transport system ATPase subunit
MKNKNQTNMEQQLSTFTELTPYERQIFIAELYHNAWYSQERYEQLYDLFNHWMSNPIKEKKFFGELDSSVKTIPNEN